MGLSEAEIEGRLAALRRQREALDREIADLVLYLELGRRLGAAGGGHPPGGAAGAAGPPPGPVPASAPDAGPSPRLRPDETAAPPQDRGAVPPGASSRGLAAHAAAPAESAGAIPRPVPFTEDAAGARRYGRALVEAACGIIAAAGRPLHATAILDRLLERGFTLPGRDPVAALNTRLWKRAGPGGPLRRVGEATYALGDPPDPEAG